MIQPRRAGPYRARCVVTHCTKILCRRLRCVTEARQSHCIGRYPVIRYSTKRGVRLGRRPNVYPLRLERNRRETLKYTTAPNHSRDRPAPSLHRLRMAIRESDNLAGAHALASKDFHSCSQSSHLQMGLQGLKVRRCKAPCSLVFVPGAASLQVREHFDQSRRSDPERN